VRQISNKIHISLPPHLKYVAALPGKLKTFRTETFLETLSTLQSTSGESVSRHVSTQMVDILNTFCEQTHANNLHIHVFLVQLASAHVVRFLLMVDRPTLLNCKASSLLRTVNEQTVKR